MFVELLAWAAQINSPVPYLEHYRQARGLRFVNLVRIVFLIYATVLFVRVPLRLYRAYRRREAVDFTANFVSLVIALIFVRAGVDMAAHLQNFSRVFLLTPLIWYDVRDVHATLRRRLPLMTALMFAAGALVFAYATAGILTRAKPDYYDPAHPGAVNTSPWIKGTKLPVPRQYGY